MAGEAAAGGDAGRGQRHPGMSDGGVDDGVLAPSWVTSGEAEERVSPEGASWCWQAVSSRRGQRPATRRKTTMGLPHSTRLWYLLRECGGILAAIVRRFAILIGVLSGCGGNVASGEVPPGAGGVPEEVSLAVGGTPPSAVPAGGVSSGPECEEVVVPPVDYECDPLGALDQCGVGRACYPTVVYPDGPCEREVYRMVCALSGSRTQWESCGGMSDCASGYVCVVSDQGTECLRVCDPLVNDCPSGLLCDPVDLAGLGACF